MKRLGLSMALALVGILPAAVWSAPLTWTTESGGNGHSYELIDWPDGVALSWDQANTEAIARDGVLATITSAEEQVFINGLLPSTHGAYWLGANRLGGSWEWVTGETWSYTNWYPGEPSGSTEPYLMLWSGDRHGQWNDEDTAFMGPGTGFIVEYVPEPSSLVLLALGGLPLLRRRRTS